MPGVFRLGMGTAQVQAEVGMVLLWALLAMALEELAPPFPQIMGRPMVVRSSFHSLVDLVAAEDRMAERVQVAVALY